MVEISKLNTKVGTKKVCPNDMASLVMIFIHENGIPIPYYKCLNCGYIYTYEKVNTDRKFDYDFHLNNGLRGN